MLNFDNAEPQMDFSPLPDGTKVKLGITIKGGGHGAQGELTKSKAEGSDNLMLSVDCTILSSPHKGRRVFENFVVEGSAEKAINISRSKIRALLNSARNIMPNDNSQNAVQARCIDSYTRIHGMVAAARLSLDTTGHSPQNRISLFIEPGDADYQTIMSGTTILPGGQANQAGAVNSSPMANQGGGQWGGQQQQPVAQQQPDQGQWGSPQPAEQPIQQNFGQAAQQNFGQPQQQEFGQQQPAQGQPAAGGFDANKPDWAQRS